MKEKEDKTHVTVIDIQALSYSHILRNTVQINLVGYCCCFVIFGLTTNTDEIYQSIIPLNLHIAPKNMDCSVYQCKKCKSEGV